MSLPAVSPAWLETGVALADAARPIARHYFRSRLVIDTKSDLSPVTIADQTIEAAMRKILADAHPDHGILGEEHGADRTDADYVWVLDPIDGTRAFVAGEETWAHSLAVAHKGKIMAGVVYLPAIDRIYTVSETSPPMKDGLPIAASGRDRLEGANILTTKANMVPEMWPGGVPEITRSFRASLAYRLCLAAEGRFDGMLTLRDAWEWDIAAGSLIAERAGAVVTDRLGRDLLFNRPTALAEGVLALPPKVHAEALQRLTSA